MLFDRTGVAGYASWPRSILSNRIFQTVGHFISPNAATMSLYYLPTPARQSLTKQFFARR